MSPALTVPGPDRLALADAAETITGLRIVRTNSPDRIKDNIFFKL
jgi:hypothetical protein